MSRVWNHRVLGLSSGIEPDNKPSKVSCFWRCSVVGRGRVERNKILVRVERVDTVADRLESGAGVAVHSCSTVSKTGWRYGGMARLRG
jgi:hypothetical protein